MSPLEVPETGTSWSPPFPQLEPIVVAQKSTLGLGALSLAPIVCKLYFYLKENESPASSCLGPPWLTPCHRTCHSHPQTGGNSFQAGEMLEEVEVPCFTP